MYVYVWREHVLFYKRIMCTRIFRALRRCTLSQSRVWAAGRRKERVENARSVVDFRPRSGRVVASVMTVAKSCPATSVGHAPAERTGDGRRARWSDIRPESRGTCGTADGHLRAPPHNGLPTHLVLFMRMNRAKRTARRMGYCVLRDVPPTASARFFTCISIICNNEFCVSVLQYWSNIFTFLFLPIFSSQKHKSVKCHYTLYLHIGY